MNRGSSVILFFALAACGGIPAGMPASGEPLPALAPAAAVALTALEGE